MGHIARGETVPINKPVFSKLKLCHYVGTKIIFLNLIPLHSMILCAMFGWNWTVSSGEDVTSCQCFYHLSPLSKGYGQISEKIWISFQLKLVLEKSLNVVIVFLLFHYYLLLYKDNHMVRSFRDIWIPFNHGSFVSSLSESKIFHAVNVFSLLSPQE